MPLPLSGNTTEQQSRMLQETLTEAVQAACHKAIEQLDRQTAQSVIDTNEELKSEVTGKVFEIIQRRAISDKFKDEEVASNRSYPPQYRVRPIEFQVTELRKIFPSLGACQEKIGRYLLPDDAEAWFAIPRWQALAPTYSQAVAMALDAIASRRRFANRIADRLGENYLRQTERSTLAERILAEQQPGCDIFVIAAQAGMLHRGSSARRTRLAMAANEFGLGLLAISSILLTHPERLSSADTLMVDCGGDEYSVHGNVIFDRVPLFDFGMTGLECSIFYSDRARDIWGSPTGFLYKLA